MSLDVRILPKMDAVVAARTAEIRALPTDKLVLHIFCDGSFKRQGNHGPRAGIGIVVIIWLPRSKTKQRTSKSFSISCGQDGGDNNTTEAFALAEGAHIALDQISSFEKRSLIRITDRIEVIFWSDSTTVLKALECHGQVPNHLLKMRKLVSIIKLKVQELQQARAEVSVQFRWCPEQCVEPHQAADVLSKEARMLGSAFPSKALTLFMRVSHSAIKSALHQGRRVPPSPHDPAGALDPAVRAITERPDLMRLLHRAAGSPRFFSVVGGMVECLPSEMRPGMHKAIRDQQDANERSRRSDQAPTDKRNEQHDTPPLILYPNHFALIETAALTLPADCQAQVLAAIDLQKKANAFRVQNEVADQIYESGGSDSVHVSHEPKVLEESMDLGESEVLSDPVAIDEPKDSEELKAVDERTDLDKVIHLEQPKLFEEPKILEEAETIEEPEMMEAAEVLEAPRPSRARAVWNWVGRKFQRL